MGFSKSSLAVCIAAVCLSAGMANADVIETLSAAPGTDLSHIYVGQQFVLQTALSSADAGEHFLTCCDVHILGSGPVNFLGSSFVTPTGGDLSTNPVLVDWTFQATGVGTVEAFNGWPDCTGLPTNNSGCAVTDLGSYRPADSNHLVFNIISPEPSSMLLITTGLTTLGAGLRRKLKK